MPESENPKPLERGRPRLGWRVLLGATTGAVVGGFLGGNIGNALSCHPYATLCELDALFGALAGILAGAVLGGVSGALIRSRAMVIPSLVLLGAFLGPTVVIWTMSSGYHPFLERNQLASESVASLIGAIVGGAIGRVSRSNRRSAQPRVR